MISRSQAKLDDAAKSVTGGTRRAIAMDMLDPAAVDLVLASVGTLDHLVLTAVADELASRAPIAALTNELTAHTLTVDGGFVAI
jgi:hypothetical protein